MKPNTTINPYQTVLLICTALLLAYWWSRSEWLLAIAIIIGVLSSSSVFITKKISSGWMKLAGVLGLFMPQLVLSVVYVALLVPLASLAKWLQPKDSLQLKKPTATTFKTVNKAFTPAAFEHPW